jgi:cardiolipin synthase A/B
VLDYLPHVTLTAMLEIVILLVFIPWVLFTKKDPTAAVAWCLVVILMPVFGALLFWVFGYSHVTRPLRRKRRHRAAFRERHPPRNPEATRGAESNPEADDRHHLGRLARRVGAFPLSQGNAITLYADTNDAFNALLDAIRQARHHVHLQFFIIRSDETGQRLIDVLAQKAKEGVEVRLLYDAMGCVRTRWALFRPLLQAGGKVFAFLPLNPIRSLIQVNLRNHRKIVVLDGRVAFTGGMNIGDEYLGKNKYFGYWRDQFMKIEGPAAGGLQRIFVEDWDFACHEALDGADYFPEVPKAGSGVVQVVESGPDQEVKSIREIFFAAITSARQRVWIASPYFVPDSGIFDALRLARYRGVDVRILSLLKPDHYIPFYAAHYYWPEVLGFGVKVYQYRKGMMHSKIMIADADWAFVGSANMDNRSLHLNFEAGCMLHTADLVAELEKQFLRDLEDAVLLDAETYAKRPFATRLTENACRLLSPLL